ncbi:NACHT domain-containing protein [Micromonospora sp. IBSANI012]|uniref:NACHT domain-containing protein n=1 Tax=Micromonospora sp. IBSANI012 TaxID=3457761 RepID=UPI0040593D90
MWPRRRSGSPSLLLFSVLNAVNSSAVAIAVNVATAEFPQAHGWTDNFTVMASIVAAVTVVSAVSAWLDRRADAASAPPRAPDTPAAAGPMTTRQRWILAVGAVTLTSGLATFIWLGAGLSGRERLTVVLTLVVFAVWAWLVAWWAVRAGRPHPTAEATRTGEAGITTRRRVLQRVDQWWVRDALHRSLQQAVRLAVALDAQPDAVEAYEGPTQAALQRLGEPEPLPDGTRLVDVYDAGRRVLLIGRPGSGKTTHLLQLTEELLRRARDDEDSPVPVVLLLSRWRTNHPDFCSWASAEIGERYGVAPAEVRQSLDDGRMILLLDGLDEVDGDYQDACLEAINSFARAENFAATGMVVTCRSQDYERLHRLAFDTALVVRPLSRGQIDRALRSAGADLDTFRHSLDRDETLRELLTTPLMLGVATIAYRGATPDLLPAGGDSDAHREVLYRLFVQRMLTRRRSLRGRPEADGASFPPREARCALIWLARLMRRRSQTVFYPDWLTPAWLPGRHPEWTLPPARGLAARLARRLGWDHTSTGLVGGGLAALIGAVATMPFGALIGGVRGAVVTAAGAAAFFGLGIGLTFGVLLQVPRLNRLFVPFIGREESTAYAASEWTTSARSAAIGFLFWSAFGAVVVGVPVALSSTWPAAALIALTLGTGGGLSGGSVPDFAKPPASPGHALRASLRRFTRLMMILLALVAALLAVTFALRGPWFAVVAALPMTVALMLTAGPGRAWLRHRAVSFGIARSGLLPPNLVDFLSYADDRVVMQRVFGGYAFIHRTLRDHLADEDPFDRLPEPGRRVLAEEVG